MLILSFMSPMAWFWLVALVIFAVAEAATVGLVSIWFAGGALVALIATGCGAPIWLQVLLFLAVSGIMLAMLRPFVRRMSKPSKTETNAGRHIGREALVMEEINNLTGTGAIKLDGITWTARSESGEVIPVGTTIVVRRIEGVKVFVAPAEKTVKA
jgi:membrane protein implicated in regulation of membrane protease activity